MTDPDDIRGEYRFKCPLCGSGFSGESLSKIANRGARHWNKEHGDELRHSHDPVTEVEYGGHHITGNSYEVKKYTVYLTSFDMMDRLGKVDGRLIIQNADNTCPECFRYIPDEEDRIEDDQDSIMDDDWTCQACLWEQDIDRKQSENQSITEWCT